MPNQSQVPNHWIKIILVASVALFASLVAINNVIDYNSNYQFVKHVLAMDTTFEGNQLMWRAISSPIMYHLFYFVIIAAEFAVAILCWLGCFYMLKANKHLSDNNKGIAIASWGLTVGIVLWFTGFMTIGGEWFLMWQSDIWNGQQAAFRIVTYFGIVLLFINN